MRIVVSGSHGLIGSALMQHLGRRGDVVERLSRPGSDEPDAYARGLGEPDAVVHLAGESIAARWTRQKKDAIRDSRVTGTRRLCEAISRLPRPPAVFVAASAIGYYGNRGDEVLTEDSPGGMGFLADVCRDWEFAASMLPECGIRTVFMRFGMILGATGGALPKMLLPFRMGFGGVVGDGKQFWSWIAIDDAVGAICHALGTTALSGPINTVAPNAVTNLEFTRTLGRLLSRPTLFPLPAFVARLVLGQMADELLLCSTRVQPARLEASAYHFGYPLLEDALRHVLADSTVT